MILRPARHENGSAPRREIRTGIAGWLPALATARSYRWGWLRHDLVAGIVLTALLVPQGMAYAGLAGVPPVLGLYATMVPLLAYAVFGPSRILVLGPGLRRRAARRRDGDPARRVRHSGADGARRPAGADGRRHLRDRRAGAIRVPDRSAVQARPRRLPERHRVGGARQPVAEAVRLLRLGGRAAHHRARVRRGPRPRRTGGRSQSVSPRSR